MNWTAGGNWVVKGEHRKGGFWMCLGRGENVLEQEHMPSLSNRKHVLLCNINSCCPPKCLVHHWLWIEGQAFGCVGSRLFLEYGLFLVVPMPCSCCRDRTAVLLWSFLKWFCHRKDMGGLRWCWSCSGCPQNIPWGWEQLQVPQFKEAAPIPCYLLVLPETGLHDNGLLQSWLYFQALAKLSSANLCATVKQLLTLFKEIPHLNSKYLSPECCLTDSSHYHFKLGGWTKPSSLPWSNVAFHFCPWLWFSLPGDRLVLCPLSFPAVPRNYTLKLWPEAEALTKGFESCMGGDGAYRCQLSSCRHWSVTGPDVKQRC